MLCQQSGPKAALRWVARLELEGTRSLPACHPEAPLGATARDLLPRRSCRMQRVASVVSCRWCMNSPLLIGDKPPH